MVMMNWETYAHLVHKFTQDLMVQHCLWTQQHRYRCAHLNESFLGCRLAVEKGRYSWWQFHTDRSGSCAHRHMW